MGFYYRWGHDSRGGLRVPDSRLALILCVVYEAIYFNFSLYSLLIWKNGAC